MTNPSLSTRADDLVIDIIELSGDVHELLNTRRAQAEQLRKDIQETQARLEERTVYLINRASDLWALAASQGDQESVDQ